MLGPVAHAARKAARVQLGKDVADRIMRRHAVGQGNVLSKPVESLAGEGKNLDPGIATSDCIFYFRDFDTSDESVKHI